MPVMMKNKNKYTKHYFKHQITELKLQLNQSTIFEIKFSLDI